MTSGNERVQELGHARATVGEIGDAILKGQSVAYGHNVDLLAEIGDDAHARIVRIQRHQRLIYDRGALELELLVEQHVEELHVHFVRQLVRGDHEHVVVLARDVQVLDHVRHDRFHALHINAQL